MKKLSLILIVLAITVVCRAGDGEYAFSKIPAELLKDANAVTRVEYTRFEVFNKTKAVYYQKIAYTILNPKGADLAECSEWYSSLRTINYIEGTLYDKDGKKIKSLKKSEIEDVSGTDGGTLANDNRYKHHKFYCVDYPYTVEYQVETRYNSTMFYPGFTPQNQANLSVQSAKMEVMLPDDMDFRYKPVNIKNEVIISRDKAVKTYTWTVNDLAAVTRELYSPAWSEITPSVYMGPVQFGIEGYEGNMATWGDYGKFVYALNSGRDVLPDNIKQIVHQLTDGMTDPHEKIAALYSYMQKNTRYISVQLGIGGWQPFNAAYVAANRYGDCKALSNYMFSLLKEAGIKSNYTLVKAGKGKNFLVKDFPSSQFTHAILSVPLQKDTMWLECTSQTLPAGYLSGFTNDRPVLIIDENGGKLIRTPRYSILDNVQTRNIGAVIDEEGNLKIESASCYKGLQEDELHSLINGSTKEKILEYLKEDIDLPNYDIEDFNYKEEMGILPCINEKLRIKAANYAQVSGKRMFISCNLLSRSMVRLPPDELRKYDIELSYEYADIDSVTIKVPSGYSPEMIPKDLNIESRFGKYTSKLTYEDGKLVYYRKLDRFSGRFPASDYNDLVKFLDQVYKADRGKVVLVKQ